MSDPDFMKRASSAMNSALASLEFMSKQGFVAPSKFVPPGRGRPMAPAAAPAATQAPLRAAGGQAAAIKARAPAQVQQVVPPAPKAVQAPPPSSIASPQAHPAATPPPPAAATTPPPPAPPPAKPAPAPASVPPPAAAKPAPKNVGDETFIGAKGSNENLLKAPPGGAAPAPAASPAGSAGENYPGRKEYLTQRRAERKAAGKGAVPEKVIQDKGAPVPDKGAPIPDKGAPATTSGYTPEQQARINELGMGGNPEALQKFHAATGTAAPSGVGSTAWDVASTMLPMAGTMLLPDWAQFPAMMGLQMGGIQKIRSAGQKRIFGYDPAEEQAAKKSWAMGHSKEQFQQDAAARKAAATQAAAAQPKIWQKDWWSKAGSLDLIMGEV